MICRYKNNPMYQLAIPVELKKRDKKCKKV